MQIIFFFFFITNNENREKSENYFLILYYYYYYKIFIYNLPETEIVFFIKHIKKKGYTELI